MVESQKCYQSPKVKKHMSLVSTYQRRMDNRLALPKNFLPPSTQQALNMNKTSYMRSISPRDQSPEPDYTNEKQSYTASKVSPYALKEKKLEAALYATISQTPKRVEPPFGTLEIPRFEQY